MPTRVAVDDDEQQIQDLIKEMRRLRSRLATTAVKGTHDEFTAAATPATTYTLTYIPLTGTCLMALNGHVQREGTDYTCDYTTGIVTVSATQASGDKITFRYLVTDWLIARSLPPETGALADNFNRADSATTPNPASDGGTWTVDNGVAGITSNKGYAVSTTTELTVRRDLGSVGMDVSVTSTRGTTSGSSFLHISVDPDGTNPVLHGVGYHLFYDSGNSVDLIKDTGGGSSALIATIACTAWTGGSSVLRLTHDGAGNLDVYQDGTHLGSYNDPGTGSYLASPLFGGTWVALGENSASPNRWDDFTAAPA